MNEARSTRGAARILGASSVQRLRGAQEAHEDVDDEEHMPERAKAIDERVAACREGTAAATRPWTWLLPSLQCPAPIPTPPQLPACAPRH